MKLRKNQKGFTLIELIVVIAILGILAALVTPRLMGFTDSANQRVDASNAKLLSNVASMIYADTGAYPTWGASFTTMTVTDAKDLIADTITYKSKTGEFTYTQASGEVKSPTSGSTPSTPSLASVTLSVTNLADDHPTITLPTAATGYSSFAWAGSTSGGAGVTISGNTATFNRESGMGSATRTVTITLNATLAAGGTQNKTFSFSVPAEAWSGPNGNVVPN